MRVFGRIGPLTAALTLSLGLLVGCATPESAPDPIVVGSADSDEMRVMAEIYAGALIGTGAVVSRDRVLGDDEQLLEEMDRTELDLFPAYTGSLLGTLTPVARMPSGEPVVGAEDVYTDLNRSLPQGVSVGDQTPVSAAPQVFVATSLAESSGAIELTECGRLPQGLPLVVVEPPSAQTLQALERTGCPFGAVEPVPDVDAALARAADGTAAALLSPLEVTADDGEVSVQALRVRVATDRRVGAPETAPSQTAAGPRAEVIVPVYRTAALSREDVKTINKVAGEITTADLAEMAMHVAAGEDPRVLADSWLDEHGL